MRLFNKGADANEYYPRHGEVNWQQRAQLEQAQDPEKGEVIGRYVLQTLWLEDGDHEQQITQENCNIFINRVADELDAIAIVDTRDGTAWWWFRGHLSNFENMYGTLALYGNQILSFYPLAEVVRQYGNIVAQDLNTLDSFPEDWDNVE